MNKPSNLFFKSERVKKNKVLKVRHGHLVVGVDVGAVAAVVVVVIVAVRPEDLELAHGHSSNETPPASISNIVLMSTVNVRKIIVFYCH